MGKRDYYEILGVARGAAPPEIRGAYRRLARRYSPDVNIWDERAVDLFEEIGEAYRVLYDPGARALYDRLGHRGLSARPERSAGGRQRGDDLHYAMEIEFEEALRGLHLALELPRLDPCQACAASGAVGDRAAVPCPGCWARPRARRSAPGGSERARCVTCGGAGWLLPEPCRACGGRGVVSGTARIPVVIPPGVDTGAQIRVPAEGHASAAPVVRGDLVVVTRVRPHPLFTRKGDHVCCEVPVTVAEAALGARIHLPTPDGPLAVSVPSGTQSGQVLRVRGRGCPRLDRGGRGDLLVTVHVVIPRNADSTMAEVLRALQRLCPGDPRAALWSGRGPA
jgi:molecular chaperone DnaJ